MRAVVKYKPEPGVTVKDVPEPNIMQDEVLIQVRAAAICGSDLGIYHYTPAYSKMKLPVVMGHEFAGEIVKAGDAVKGFNLGDRVLSESVKACGSCSFCREGMSNLCEASTLFGIHTDGGFAEYVAVPYTLLHMIPDDMSFEEAAIVEPLSNALHFVKDCTSTKLGDLAIVHGVGPIGLLSAQVLKLSGIRIIITGISADTERFRIAEELGFESLNVEKEALIEKVMKMTDGAGADIAFVATGAASALRQAIQLVKKRGQVTVVGIFPKMVEIPVTHIVRREIQIFGAYDAKPVNFEQSIDLIQRGKVNVKDLITHRLHLEAAEEAFQLAISKKGCKILFTP